MAAIIYSFKFNMTWEGLTSPKESSTFQLVVCMLLILAASSLFSAYNIKWNEVLLPISGKSGWQKVSIICSASLFSCSDIISKVTCVITKAVMILDFHYMIVVAPQ